MRSCNRQLDVLSISVVNDRGSLIEIINLEKRIKFLLNIDWLFFNISKRSLEYDFYQIKNLQGLGHLYHGDLDLHLLIDYLLESIIPDSTIKFSYERIDYRLICELLSRNDVPILSLVDHLKQLRTKYDDGIIVKDIIRYLDTIVDEKLRGDVNIICSI